MANEMELLFVALIAAAVYARILVRKWLILKRTMEVDIEFAKDIISACVILHNYTLRAGEECSSIPTPNNSSSHLAGLQPVFAGDQHTELGLDHLPLPSPLFCLLSLASLLALLCSRPLPSVSYTHLTLPTICSV